jgi:hypothetical protein
MSLEEDRNLAEARKQLSRAQVGLWVAMAFLAFSIGVLIFRMVSGG